MLEGKPIISGMTSGTLPRLTNLDKRHLDIHIPVGANIPSVDKSRRSQSAQLLQVTASRLGGQAGPPQAPGMQSSAAPRIIASRSCRRREHSDGRV